ncbi:hypothetical protein Gotri_000714 [Gossypium trilobum]|uniref:hAT-like transposase RNase-H fold domain-containing protein n=1 Tax=Gossypium trilobum TaxID=34281 RepID=A0A7J9FC70_9ROSI|nr:hypothetical protein [Gossypium trilobum]
MSIASPNFKNISRQPAIRDVLMYYAKERDHAKKELAKAPGLICLTFDNWNSEYTNDEYICITAHWVYKDRKLQKKIIRFIDLSPPYDVRCCAHILNLIVKAGLELVDDVVDVLDLWGQREEHYQIFALSDEEWRNVAILCKFFKCFMMGLVL